MIDIHTHILPEIDDGPRDWKESLALLRQGEADGIKGAVCTSHVLNKLDETVERRFIQVFGELKERARQEGIQMSLWLGSEIHCQSVFSYTSKIATLNGNKKYLLFELPLNDIPSDTGQKIFELGLSGIVPILAHPERNIHIMKHPETVYELANRGVLMQINAGSITGVFGKQVKKIAQTLMNHRLVHFVGSDCHGGQSRPMILSHAYKAVLTGQGEETAGNLFHKNAALAIQGKPVQADPAVPFGRGGKKRWFGFS